MKLLKDELNLLCINNYPHTPDMIFYFTLVQGNLIHQNNVELYQKMDQIQKENAELQKKVYGSSTSEENVASSPSYMARNGYDLHAPISLQLSQPQTQYSESSTKTGLVWIRIFSSCTEKKAKAISTYSLSFNISRVGISFPTIEARFEHLNVEAEAYVGSRALPTFINFIVNTVKDSGVTTPADIPQPMSEYVKLDA
ncbi:MADS-box transcription factor [Vigna unguiculata]|uniref:MADS-box transcription factor n=1 Tax=Vigna unguiculata TaxID=3917 RepID=A0A4D6LE10_VIGUN|nr:MADS-box transcription factor [Vigna unguiculata]